MGKEEALEELFKSLKMSFKNASIYPPEHPALKKSVSEVKEKIDVALNYLSPLKIGFTPNSLLVDGQYFEKESLYEELARIFHVQRIKMIEVKQGLSIEELMTFLTKVYLSPKEVLKKGGFSHILEEEKITHLAVEELDYSQLLKGEGEEIKDIWPHLLQEAVEKEDIKKISELADNFEKVVGHFKIEELLENEQFKGNIDKFFAKLQNMEKDKFRKCSKELLKFIVKSQNISRETKLEKARTFFKDLSDEDIASTLLEEIITDEDFNSLSFQIFSELSERTRHKNIAVSFKEQFQKKSILHSSPKIREKIKELMTGSSSSVISEVYRETLSTLLRDISSEGEMTFDQKHLQKNYHFILLSLLEEEQRKKRVVNTLEKILDEWDNIIRERNLEYFKHLIEVLNKRRGDLTSEPVFTNINTNILDYMVDQLALREKSYVDFEDFITYLQGSFLSSKPYLDKIFQEEKINTQIMKFFFRLHPDSLPLFKKNLKEKSSDTEFIKKLLESLEEADSPESKEIYKYILSFGTESTKIEVLKTVQQSSAHDEKHLFSLLEKGSDSLKKEALGILIKDESTKEKALEKLFSIPSFFGTKNKILLDHIRIAGEMDLKDAKDNLVTLSRKKFFWNKKLKEEASKVLEKWDARKN